MRLYDLKREARIAQMARALRPFANIDLPNFSKAALASCGFSRNEIADLECAAVRTERMRRNVMEGR